MERRYYDENGIETPKGEYVLTAIPAEDGSITYWLAKKGYMVAHYCFTIGHGGSPLKAHLQQQCMDSYIRIYKAKFERGA